MTEQLPETTHFQIVHAHWNHSNGLKPFSIQPKREMTDSSRALVPMPVSADSVEALLVELEATEKWYVENRRVVDAQRRAA